MDSPAYSLPGIYGITQLSPTPESVINLGHKGQVPLIRPPSELSDGSEPHDQFYSADMTRAAAVQCGSGMWHGRGVPGVVQARWVPEGGIPGTNPAVSLRPD